MIDVHIYIYIKSWATHMRDELAYDCRCVHWHHIYIYIYTSIGSTSSWYISYHKMIYLLIYIYIHISKAHSGKSIISFHMGLWTDFYKIQGCFGLRTHIKVKGTTMEFDSKNHVFTSHVHNVAISPQRIFRAMQYLKKEHNIYIYIYIYIYI